MVTRSHCAVCALMLLCRVLSHILNASAVVDERRDSSVGDTAAVRDVQDAQLVLERGGQVLQAHVRHVRAVQVQTSGNAHTDEQARNRKVSLSLRGVSRTTCAPLCLPLCAPLCVYC